MINSYFWKNVYLGTCVLLGGVYIEIKIAAFHTQGPGN